MSMNILVRTQVYPQATFLQDDPILNIGEIAIDEEGLAVEGANVVTGVKIGDGNKKWSELTYVPELTEEIVNKWLTIATSSTDSRLVMLPDFNFAYTVVDVDKNAALIEIILEKLMANENYIRADITPEIFTTSEAEVTTYNLHLSTSDALGLFVENLSLAKRVSSFSLDNKSGEEAQKILFNDIELTAVVTELNKMYLNRFSILEDGLKNIGTEIENIIENIIVPFKVGVSGIVNAPTEEQNSSNYFLNAKNEWAKVALYGTEIPLSPTSSESITAAINRLSAEIIEISVGEIPADVEENFYLTAFSEENVVTETNSDGTTTSLISSFNYNKSIYINKNVLYGAAWNDYAECRITENVQPGRVVVENGDDTLSISTKRLMLGGNIVSDTYGMLIGQTEEAKTPIALCGRVLAYPYENRCEFYAGAPVCTGPNGTVSIMSKDEVLHYPECIIGYVSAVPEQEVWRGKLIDGRIWIKVI